MALVLDLAGKRERSLILSEVPLPLCCFLLVGFFFSLSSAVDQHSCRTHNMLFFFLQRGCCGCLGGDDSKDSVT